MTTISIIVDPAMTVVTTTNTTTIISKDKQPILFDDSRSSRTSSMDSDSSDEEEESSSALFSSSSHHDENNNTICFTTDDDDLQEEQVQKQEEPQEPQHNNETILTTSQKEQKQSSNNKKKFVCFGMVEIIEFPIEAGIDKVPATGGPPIGMGFIEQFKSSLKVDAYEQHKPEQRRKNHQMVIPHNIRSAMLLANDVTMREVIKCQSEADQIRKDRIASAHHVQWDRFHFLVESAQRKMKRRLHVFSKKSSSSTTTKTTTTYHPQEHPVCCE